MITYTSMITPQPSNCNCRFESYIGAIKNFHNCHIFQRCLEVSRVDHISHRLHVALCIIFVATMVVISSLLSGGPASLGAGGTGVRFGRRNVVGVASGSSGGGLRPLGLTSTGTKRTSVSERGKVCFVQECTLESLLNPAQSPTHSTPNNLAASLSLFTRELRFNARNGNILGGSIHSEVGPTVIEPGSQRGFSIPLRPTLAIDGTRQTYSAATWDRSPTCLWEGASSPTASPRSNFSGCHHHPIATLFILAIAVDEATHDLDIFRLISGASKQGRIRFSSLDRDVSLDKIYATITQLYGESAKIPDSELLILLTGHGDSANRMCLHEGEFIDEADLYQLFEKLRNTRPTLIPVTIFFDICRESEKSGGEPPAGVDLIWSCSPGESAHAFRLPHDPKIPHSCFLLALIMGSCLPDLTCNSEIFKSRVKKELDRLTVYLQKVHSLRQSDRKCTLRLDSNELCKELRQSIDWRNAKNMNGIFMLMEALVNTEIAQEVHRSVTMNPLFRTANKLLPVDQAGQGSKLELCMAASITNTGFNLCNAPESDTSGHVRGVNESVHAA